MEKLKRIAIGIQARLSSERLPRKVLEDIHGRPMLDYVIHAAKNSAKYVNGQGTRSVSCSVFLLIPEQEPELKQRFAHDCKIVEGSLDDVLSRFVTMQAVAEADWVVRITGDCPLLNPAIVTKCITCAEKMGLDYISNVHQDLRTSPDGMDCEVISSRLLLWLDENATDPKDREHVTTLLRKENYKNLDGFRVGHVVDRVDMSEVKLSVDTEEDLAVIRKKVKKVRDAEYQAKAISGHNSVFRF